MVKWLKITSLCALTLWSIGVWFVYFQKATDVSQANPMNISADYELSDNFWTWEAQGRLRLTDMVLDINYEGDLKALANHMISLQNQAYNVTVDKPSLKFIALRGDANGLYVPEDKTIYLNNKMDWRALSVERYAEVIFHENMHHNMTYGQPNEEELIRDFSYLSLVGFHHQDFAMRVDEKEYNPQEYVAYRSQRAGRYVGLNYRDLSVWEITTRMQEIRAIKDKAGL